MQKPTPSSLQFFLLLKSVHKTTGILVFPLVLLAGLTGFYLNHGKPLSRFFAQPPTAMAAQSSPWSQEEAEKRAVAILGGPVNEDVKRRKKDRFYFRAHANRKRLVGIDPQSHTYWLITRHGRTRYDANGAYLEHRWFLRRIAKDIHTGKIIGWGGRLLADLVSLCLVVFAITGIVMWFLSRNR